MNLNEKRLWFGVALYWALGAALVAFVYVTDHCLSVGIWETFAVLAIVAIVGVLLTLGAKRAMRRGLRPADAWLWIGAALYWLMNTAAVAVEPPPGMLLTLTLAPVFVLGGVIAYKRSEGRDRLSWVSVSLFAAAAAATFLVNGCVLVWAAESIG